MATHKTILGAFTAVTKNLDNIPKNIMEEVEDNAKSLTPVRTGNLKASYSQSGGSKLSEPGYVRNNADYASAVEYGTTRTPARRMMTQAAAKVNSKADKYV